MKPQVPIAINCTINNFLLASEVAQQVEVPQFDPWDSHCGRRELTPTSYPIKCIILP